MKVLSGLYALLPGRDAKSLSMSGHEEGPEEGTFVVQELAPLSEY